MPGTDLDETRAVARAASVDTAILRHTRIALTMEIYTQVPDKVPASAVLDVGDHLRRQRLDESGVVTVTRVAGVIAGQVLVSHIIGYM